MLQRLSATAEALGPRGRRRSPPRPRSCPSRTRASTSSSATPSSTTSPTWSAPSPNSAASCAPAARSPSPASPRATATASPRPRSAPACSPPPPGGARSAPAAGSSPRPSSPTATRSRARSTSTPSPPPTCAACCATRASSSTARRRRGAARQRLGLGPAHGRVERRARIGLLELAQLRLPQLHRPAEGRHPAARAPPPGRALLQPARQRPQAGLVAPSPTPSRLRRARKSLTPESIPFSFRSPAKE